MEQRGKGLKETALQELVERARFLHDDLELEAVSSWKSAEPGRAAIG